MVLAAGDADARSCRDAAVPPQIYVEVERGRIVVDDSLTRDEIGVMASDSPVLADSGVTWRRVGLTKVGFRMGSSASLRLGRSGGDDAYCVTVQRVTLSLGFPEMIIYIPRSYAPESCAYGQILAHEHEHIAAHRRSLEDFLPRFRQAARQALDGAVPFRAHSQAEARETVLRALKARLDPVLSAFQEAQRASNHALDTADEYQTVQSRCSDW